MIKNKIKESKSKQREKKHKIWAKISFFFFFLEAARRARRSNQIEQPSNLHLECSKAV
jgi:hypothetical protein